MILASVERNGRAVDALGVQIDPQASAPALDGRSPNVAVSLGANAYRTGEQISVDAAAPGAQGKALVTLESSAGVQFDLTNEIGGRAAAHLRALDAAGELRVGAAFVHDGALEWSTVPLSLSAPGRPHLSPLSLRGEQLSAGQPARIALDTGDGGRGTFVVRISRGAPSGSALFSSAPGLLAIGVTTTQNSAPESLTWHPWVDSTGNHAQVLGFVRRSQPPPDESLAQAESETVSWRIVRGGPEGVAVVLPERGGRYVLSVLDISDDGSVSAGSSTIEVH
jgi:hypothetical protein